MHLCKHGLVFKLTLFQLLYSPQLFTDGLIFKDEDVNEFELELVVDVSMTHYFRKSSRLFKYLKLQKRKNLTATKEKFSNFQKSL